MYSCGYSRFWQRLYRRGNYHRPSCTSRRAATCRAPSTLPDPGDEIVLESGALYTGALRFPEKGGTLPIVVGSSEPAPNRRVTPDDRALLVSLGSGSTSPAAAITGSHWHFVGLAFRATTNGDYDIISISRRTLRRWRRSRSPARVTSARSLTRAWTRMARSSRGHGTSVTERVRRCRTRLTPSRLAATR